MQHGVWTISEKFGTSRGQRIDTGQYDIAYEGKSIGYYSRKPGMPVFVCERPGTMSESQQDDLLELVRALDEEAGIADLREVVFSRGIETATQEKMITPVTSDLGDK